MVTSYVEFFYEVSMKILFTTHKFWDYRASWAGGLGQSAISIPRCFGFANAWFHNHVRAEAWRANQFRSWKNQHDQI